MMILPAAKPCLSKEGRSPVGANGPSVNLAWMHVLSCPSREHVKECPVFPAASCARGRGLPMQVIYRCCEGLDVTGRWETMNGKDSGCVHGPARNHPATPL